MNNLRWKRMKWIMMASVMLFSGVCYRCSQERPVSSGKDAENVLHLSSRENEETSDLVSAKIDMPETAEESAPLEVSGGDADVSAKETPDAVVLEERFCLVHICGAVNCPGVYPLPEGSRIYQAIEQAGGFLPEADQDFLNLAQPVGDGMKITVWTKQEAETAASGQGIILSGKEELPGNPVKAKVNINTAGKEELMTLRGIGASRAEDIIAYREKHGSFQKIEDIMKVSGIKDAAFEKIKEDITV